MEQDYVKKIVNDTQALKYESLNELTKVLKGEIQKSAKLLASEIKGESIEVSKDIALSRVGILIDLVDKLTKLR